MVDQPVNHRTSERGYVLLGVLLIIVLITSMVLTFSRHSVMVADSAQATLSVQAAEDAADSGLAWARQSLLADGSTQASLDMGDGRRVNVSLTDAGTDRRSILVEASGSGVRQRFDATAETYARAGSRAPGLTSDAKAAVAGSAGLVEISGAATYTNTELSGILYMRDGATLTLDNVVLDGSVVSEAALFTGAGGGTLHLRNGVLVSPGPELPGVALAVPGVDVTGNGSERVQLEGVVVASSLTLPGTGALHGPIASLTDAVLSPTYDLVGEGRAPRAWPAAIDTRSFGVRRVSFPVPDPSVTEESSIRTYGFP
jgi:Tfp pilus assembly protein PilX